MEGYGSGGLSGVIHRLGGLLIGEDPRPVERHHRAALHGLTRQAPGGINQQAIAAIENALVDSRRGRSGCRCTRCWAGRCATAFRSIGRIAARIGWATASASRQ